MPARPIKASRFFRLHVLLSGLVFACGCGRPAYEVAPVSGRVLMDNQPTAGIGLSFQPIADSGEGAHVGSGSFATTDDEGRFTLELVDPPQAGAVVGVHAVRFSLRDPNAKEEDQLSIADLRLPAKYRNGSITFEVPSQGTDQAIFNLKTR
ncbi:MAG: hypothetical protein JXB10_00080 [Pirellulales bacterium]|nr:hypothetical protein [Pirellulales bacterium]